MPAKDHLRPALMDKLRGIMIEFTGFEHFDIVREIEVSDGAGGVTQVLSKIATGMCSLDGPFSLSQSRLVVANSTKEGVTPWQISLPYGTDVRAQDRIILNGSRKFDVLVKVQEEYLGLDTVALCEEVA
jgi:hypothetical protein